MSVIPSLIIWSSIKIPHPGHSYRKRNEISQSVPHESSSEKTKKRNTKIVQEVVSLRVPSPLRIEKENSAPDATCPSQDVCKKTSDCKNPKGINCLRVPVPDVPEFDATQNQDFLRCYCSVHNCSPCCEASFYDDLYKNLNSEKFPDSDDGMGFDSIPSVKPCTAEDLRMVKESYHLTEKKSRKTKKKNKQRIKVTQSNPMTPGSKKETNLNYSKSGKSLTQKSSYRECDKKETDVSYSSALSGKEYYEGKLAELYLIELGINKRKL